MNSKHADLLAADILSLNIRNNYRFEHSCYVRHIIYIYICVYIYLSFFYFCLKFRIDLDFYIQREEDGVNVLESDSPSATYHHNHHSQATAAIVGGRDKNNDPLTRAQQQQTPCVFTFLLLRYMQGNL